MNETAIPITELPKSWPFPAPPAQVFEQAARTFMEPMFFNIEWPKIQQDLEGCKVRAVDHKDALREGIFIVINGLDPKLAGIYQDKYARIFLNALVGCYRLPILEVIFEIQASRAL
jgi:hypothetical protein